MASIVDVAPATSVSTNCISLRPATPSSKAKMTPNANGVVIHANATVDVDAYEGGISLAEVEAEEDEQVLQGFLGKLTDMSPETFEKRRAIRQRIVDIKAKSRENREKERQEREKRREEDVARRRKEREQERKERLERIQDLSKTRPDPASTSQEFLKKRRDSATKLRQQEIEAINKASFTRQTSIADDRRDEELKTKMEVAKEDRERQMRCMQDIRRMSLTGATWRSASPALSPTSFMSFNRRQRTSTTSSTDESAAEEISADQNNPDEDKNNSNADNNNNHGSGVRGAEEHIPETFSPSNLNPLLSRTGDISSSSTSTPTPNHLPHPSNGSSSATASKGSLLLLTPNSSSTSGLKAAIRKAASTVDEGGSGKGDGEDASLAYPSTRRYPNAPALRRSSRSWTMPRQSGTQFRRNSRVQPTNVADARSRFEEVDNKTSSPDSSVSRSKSFSPATASAASATTIKASLLAWCQQKTRGYRGVDVKNFSSSWADGLAFAAISHHYAPDAFQWDELDSKDRRKNFEIAFRVADETLGAMPLLEVDDMILMKDRPDWKCVFTYVQSLYRHGRDFEAKRAKREE